MKTDNSKKEKPCLVAFFGDFGSNVMATSVVEALTEDFLIFLRASEKKGVLL